jgi:hypothetical protein
MQLSNLTKGKRRCYNFIKNKKDKANCILFAKAKNSSFFQMTNLRRFLKNLQKKQCKFVTGKKEVLKLLCKSGDTNKRQQKWKTPKQFKEINIKSLGSVCVFHSSHTFYKHIP